MSGSSKKALNVQDENSGNSRESFPADKIDCGKRNKMYEKQLVICNVFILNMKQSDIEFNWYSV